MYCFIYNLDINDPRAPTYSRTLPFLPPEEPAPLPTQKKSHDRIKLVAISYYYCIIIIIYKLQDINGKHPLNTFIVPFILTRLRSTRPSEKIFLDKTKMLHGGCFRLVFVMWLRLTFIQYSHPKSNLSILEGLNL